MFNDDFEYYIQERWEGMIDLIEAKKLNDYALGRAMINFSKSNNKLNKQLQKKGAREADKYKINQNNKNAKQLQTNFLYELKNANDDKALQEVKKYLDEIIRRLSRELSADEKKNLKPHSSGWYLDWFKNNGETLINERKKELK